MPHLNQYHFHTIRLWEHADRIRGGDLPELAPLLVLCEDRPTEATLRRERELILSPQVSERVRADLLAVALTVGTRYFARDLLESVFREEMEMLKGASFIEEWIEEGEARGARRVLLRQLRKRFGELPDAVVARVNDADPTWCEEMGERILDGGSLEDLGLSEAADIESGRSE